MANLIVAPAAELDVIVQAGYYLGQNAPEAADRWLNMVRETFEFLLANPNLGQTLRPDVRAWRVSRFPRHVVLYRTTPGQVEVIRVVHGASDIDAALQSGMGD